MIPGVKWTQKKIRKKKMKKYSFYKKELEEQEIDLIEMCFYILSKWKLYIILGIIGLVVGIPLGIFMAKSELPDPDNLSPSIVAQLDNYANQKKLDEKLNEDDRELYVMSLNPNDTYYEAVIDYTVRTDNREDAILASKYLNLTTYREHLDKLAEITGYDGYINNLKGFLSYTAEISEATENNQGMTYFGQGISSTESTEDEENSINNDAIRDLQTAVSEAVKTNGKKTEDLEKIISSLNKKGKAYANLTYTISYLNEQDMNKFIEWLDSEIERVGKENCSDYQGFDIKRIKMINVPLRPTQVENYQQSINARIAERATATDIIVETMLSKYATTINATSDHDGFTAIITEKEKKEYEKYWISISDPEYEGNISKFSVIKWMIIIAVLMAFIGIGCTLMKYIAKPQVVSEAVIRDIFKLDIIGYVNEGKTEKKGLDKIFSWVSVSMIPASFDYISKIMADKEGDICIIKTSAERDIAALTDKLKAAKKNCVCGDISTDTAILEKAKAAESVYIVTEPGVTPVSSLEALLHMIDMYEISFDGIVMI